MSETIFKALLLVILTGSFLFAQYKLEPAFPELTFSSPVDFQVPPGDSNRIFVVEQPGRIKVFENSKSVTSSKTFLDLTDSVIFGGERGLLGLAFHPKFSENRYFYVNYTSPGPLHTNISRFKVSDNPDSAVRSSEVVILTFGQPYVNHNGGQVAFGPDGYLYIATGDGGSAGDPQNNAQNTRNSFLGKILRINIDTAAAGWNYSIPPDNPFIGALSILNEIYAYGLRNPWRFSFDSNGTLWCADVGQNEWEEIDTIKSGGNYGWRIMEGTHCYNPSSNCDTAGLILPVYEYPHNSEGGFSVTGGFVYEGNILKGLKDKYIFADYVSRKIWALTLTENSASVDLLTTASDGISSFGKDTEGELYICSFDGKIYKLVSSASSVDNPFTSPGSFSLFQNYPNPFNPSTNIKYYVPEESSIRIDIINSAGELITRLTDEIKSEGEHNITWNGTAMASGVYYVRMNAESLSGKHNFQQTLKIMLLK